jgi:hypothetical protein
LTDDGYRDIKANVLVNGIWTEIRVNVPEMIAAKKEAHPLYERVAKIERAADTDKRGLTKEELAEVNDLKTRQRRIYDSAWEAATRDRKAASPQRVPLRDTDVSGNQRGDSPSQALASPSTRVTGTPSTSKNSVPAGNDLGSAISASASILDDRPAGRDTIVTTERGMEVPVRYRLVDADDLITSNDDALKVDPRFPAELQPRDRTRQASADQIAKIANGIRPEWMAESPKASDGAPIIGADAVVESGNARTIALRRAYAMGKADHYREWLMENAGRFGLTADDVRGMKRPVLVRQGLGDYDRAEFARQANESTVAEMSATERARADAGTLPDLEGLQFDEAGNVDARASADWIRSYIQTTVGPNKRGEIMTATGELSQSGATRIRNAVLMKAYNDEALVERVSESLDPGTKNVLNGLSRAAPDVAKLQDMAAAGAREAPTWVPEAVEAVRRFADAREAGQTVNEYLSQGSLLGGEASPAVAAWMQQIEAFNRAPKRLADHIRALVREAMKDPRQGGLDLDE